MQIKGLHKGIYRLSRYASKHLCDKKADPKYLEPVTLWDQLKSQGVSDAGCAAVIGISRATYFRYKTHIRQNRPAKKPRNIKTRCWGESEKQRVLQVRRANPTYGKAKIQVILKRDFGLSISESTVGRILRHLADNRLITRSTSAFKTKRKRVFKGHAQPWTYQDYRNIQLGERVQIDHMTVTKNGITFKHFQAWDRRSKFVDAQVYSRATSRCAKDFLESFIDKAPFKVSSIQVDGGSEFMAEFEQACSQRGIALIVLPPSKPAYNGGVERTNRTFREEFYNQNQLLADSVGAMRIEVKQALWKYNHYRPHFALKGATPVEYITGLHREVSQSQIG